MALLGFLPHRTKVSKLGARGHRTLGRRHHHLFILCHAPEQVGDLLASMRGRLDLDLSGGGWSRRA